MPIKRPDVYEMKTRAEGITGDRPIRHKRGRGRSRYMRRTLLRILSLSPEERSQYVPRSGFESAAMALLNAALLPSGQYSVAGWKEIRETLGEKIGSNWKATMDELEEKPTIINDIPTPHRKQ